MNESPSHILYLLGGRAAGESLVPMCGEWARQIEWDCRQSLVTTCGNYADFPGDTYHVTEERGTVGEQLKRYGSIGRWHQTVVQVAKDEGMLLEADIIVTIAQSGLMLIYVDSLFGGRMRRRPTIYLSPKVPEASVIEFSPGEEEGQLFWYLTGWLPQLHVVTLDNDREVELAEAEMKAAYPRTRSKVRRLRFWRFTEEHWNTTGKRDVVVYSGRVNKVKGIDNASEVFALLGGHGIAREMYVTGSQHIPQSMMRTINALDIKLAYGLPSEEYRQAAGTAKVLLIASQVEGQPLGYLELLERGVVPVIRRRAWMRTFLGEDWPLVYDNAGEAVAQCMDALEQYERYAKKLRECLLVRYSQGGNGHTIMSEIWREFVASIPSWDHSPRGLEWL